MNSSRVRLGHALKMSKQAVVTIVCERCAQEVTMPYNNDYREGIKAARLEKGWYHRFVHGEWHSFCCQQHYREWLEQQETEKYEKRCKDESNPNTFTDAEITVVIDSLRGRLWRLQEEQLKVPKWWHKNKQAGELGNIKHKIKVVIEGLEFYEQILAMDLQTRYKFMPKLV